MIRGGVLRVVIGREGRSRRVNCFLRVKVKRREGRGEVLFRR